MGIKSRDLSAVWYVYRTSIRNTVDCAFYDLAKDSRIKELNAETSNPNRAFWDGFQSVPSLSIP